MNTKVYKKYDVALDNSKYEIIVGKNIIENVGQMLRERTKDNRVMIIIDNFVSKSVLNPLIEIFSQNGFQTFFHLFESGKQNKNFNEAINIYEKLEQNNFARDSTIIAVGGGVIGDLAGFVASTYLRGINLIHIPTTLTAMIDSSLGGKVALNFQLTVNAIGNYYHPIFNLIDIQFLESLPDRDYKAGISEIIKCAIISDKKLFSFLSENPSQILNRNENMLLVAMYGAIEIKFFHVSDDVKEQGKRLKLNYGHTLGHAIETCTGIFEETYRHGEGVALGMVGAAHIARDYFSSDNNEIIDAHEEILKKYDLPICVASKEIGFEREKLIAECLKIILKDKKRKEHMLRFILPLEIGNSAIFNDIPEDYIQKAYNYVIR